MKMPTTTNTKVKNEHKAPKSLDLNTDESELSMEGAGRQCVTFLEKKMRNLEKRKKKMDLNRQKVQAGEKLEKEAQLSLEQYDSVAQDLQFAGELHSQFLSINEKHEESVKSKAKKEIKRIEEILKLQFTLDQLGGDSVRQDFMTGKHGAVLLSKDNLDQLDALYQVISPTRESQEKDNVYAQKLYTAAEHLVNFIDGEDCQVAGTTYKELKRLVTLINGCGYFERVQTVETQEPRDQGEVEETEEDNVEVEQSAEEPEPVIEQTAEDPVETVDDIAQPVEETKAQPLNTLEQDAFFAPSSSPYSPTSGVSESVAFSSQSEAINSVVVRSKSSLPDIQSFTHNRPFQFIQTSYVMPEDSNSPSVVDPAVIAAQPAGAHGLQFMSPMYESNVVTPSPVVPQQSQPPQPQQLPTQQQHQQPQQPPQQHTSHQSATAGSSLLSSQPPPPQQQQQHPSSQAVPSPAVSALGMPVDLSQSPVDLSQSGVKQQQQTAAAPQVQEFNAQSTFPQSESLFPNQPVSHHDVSSSSLPGHSDSRATSLREESISSINYEIPPSIPMPPSQSQDPTQVEPQEKKSPMMNANAPVFQSMYAQGLPHQVTMPPPSVTAGVSLDTQVPPAQVDFAPAFGGPSGDFVSSGGDFQSGYQGSNGYANGNNYNRGPSGGNRGGYRGPRGGGGGGNSGPNNMNNRNGGSPLQNGFGTRSSPTNGSNSRGARGGGSYQNYAPNPNYRPESFQPSGYGSSSFGNANYSKRGGMNNTMGGPGNGAGYQPRPAGMGGNANRGGAMRGGMGTRGGPRGGGPHRGGFRPQ